VIVMTAWGSIELAVEATRSGSSDFIQKPWDNGHLLEVVRKQLELGRELRLKHQLEAAREQSQTRELAEAREIQRWLLPREIPQILNCEISAVWQPVREVSGDYFDVMKFNDHQTALCIADVMGKGMPAALLMANLQAVMRSFASSTTSPKDLCARINSLICSNVDAGKFITLFYGLVDMNEKRLLYTNAGHNAPVLIHRDGSCERLSEGGTVLGLIYDGYYSMGEVELRSGDRLVMFTDGLTEARDANDEEFGEERLLNLLRGFKELAARELEQEITRAVNEFSHGEMGDDMTMIVVAIE
jgi:phosphoserine phosphatase RsbU/P